MDTSGNTKMSIEQKAKAYDMALEGARKELGVDRKEWEVVQRVLHNIFPELAESEDERMMREFNDWLCEEIECRTNDLRDEKDRRTLNMLCYILTKVKDWLEKQKEQKPVEWKPTEEQFNYLAKAITTLGEEGDCKTAGVLSEIRNGLKCSFPDWKVSPDYPEEGCNVSLNGEVKKIQGWSEDDEKMVKEALYCVGYTFGSTHPLVAWLKSLRPSWKPSEEQMEALETATHIFPKDAKYRKELELLKAQLNKLI